MNQLKELFSPDFGDTLLRFALCYLVNWIIVNFLYFKKAKRRDFFFTFMIISVAIFFLVYLMMGMDRGKATMGVGLGLFGIFSIMRYRTDAMPVREMTYLFVVVCLSVVHPERREELKADLEARLGLKVVSVRVGAVDFLRDMTVLRVYYEGNDSGDVKNMLKIKNSDYASV